MSFELQNAKVQIMAVPQSVATNGTITSNTLDTLGYDEVLITLHAHGVASTASVPGSVKIQHADTTDATNFGNISGYTATTSTSGYPTQVAASSTTSMFAKFHLDMKGKKRYLRALIEGGGSGGTTCLQSVVAILGRADAAPTGTNTGALFVVNPS